MSNNIVQNIKIEINKLDIRDDKATLDSYSRTTLPQSSEPLGVALPKNKQQLKKLIEFANNNKIGLYPISRGLNWGYGSCCAAVDNQIIVDLSYMNKILEIDPKLGYAVIEPGVTQNQLYLYLKEHNIPFILDCTGSGPDASITGNTVDRGFGHTPYGDHFLNTCGIEVILGDGRLLKTGFGHYKNAKSTNVYKWGIGPYLEGLFSQSNYGIVTKIGIWLMPKPEKTVMFFCSVPEDRQLTEIINNLRPLKLSGKLKSLVHIGNDLRVISSFKRYPFKDLNNKTPLPETYRKTLREKGGFGAWNVSGAIYGNNDEIKLLKKQIKKALKPVGKPKFIGNNGIKITKKINSILSKYNLLEEQRVKLSSLEKVYGLLKGEPTEAFLYGTLWRIRDLKNANSTSPLDNNVGLLWVSPILPMTGESASEMLTFINPIFEKFGFEPLITVTLITERSMVSIITIAYDKSIPEEVISAEKCYDELYEIILDKGYIPYRTNIFSMNKLSKNSDVFWDVADQIKTILDPNGIISPGRYQPNFFKKEKD